MEGNWYVYVVAKTHMMRTHVNIQYSIREPSLATAGSARVNAKKKEVRRTNKEKGIEAERERERESKATYPNLGNWAIGGLTGEEE